MAEVGAKSLAAGPSEAAGGAAGGRGGDGERGRASDGGDAALALGVDTATKLAAGSTTDDAAATSAPPVNDRTGDDGWEGRRGELRRWAGDAARDVATAASSG